MSHWITRKAVGDPHEQRVWVELERRSWDVSWYGQGILSESIRQALQTTGSFMRYDADMIAARGSSICRIDAKNTMCGTNTWTFTISRKVVRAGLRMWADLEIPVYYVFANLGVATPFEVLQFCRLTTIGEAGGYLSFPAGLPRPFDDVFGSPVAVPSLPLAA